MTVTSMVRNNLYDNFLVGNTAYDPSATWLIQRVSGTGSSNVITFSSIPQTYKHLQLRISAIKSSGSGDMRLYVNGDTGNNYTWHTLAGYNGSVYAAGNTAQSYCLVSSFVGTRADMSTTIPSVAIVDIHDYTASKNKVLRSVGGIDQNVANNSDMNINSGMWLNTAAITSISIFYSGGGGAGGNFSTGTTFGLYGITG